MGTVAQALVLIVDIALVLILALKSASLLHGAIWAFGAGGTAAAEEAEALATAGQPIDWYAIERRHGHRSLVQSRLEHVKPRTLRLGVAAIYKVYVLIPVASFFLLATAGSLPDATALLVASISAVAWLLAICLAAFLLNEFARAVGFGAATQWHWSVQFQRAFRSKPFTKSPGAGIFVAALLLAVLVQLACSSLTYFAVNRLTDAFSWDDGTVVPATIFWSVRVWAFAGSPKASSQWGYALAGFQGACLATSVVIGGMHAVNQRKA
jgi:hypothetical protein